MKCAGGKEGAGLRCAGESVRDMSRRATCVGGLFAAESGAAEVGASGQGRTAALLLPSPPPPRLDRSGRADAATAVGGDASSGAGKGEAEEEEAEPRKCERREDLDVECE